MTTAKHTPGPWHLDRDGDGVVMISRADGGHIGQMFFDGDRELVAAAPDLLDALESLVDDLRGRIADGEKFNPGTLTAFEIARDAIAKAKAK